MNQDGLVSIPLIDPNARKSMFFSNGPKLIDFVLVWEEKVDDKDDSLKELAENREIFEKNLQRAGLELEYDKIDTCHCVKIHAPVEVLQEIAELLNLRMPLKRPLPKIPKIKYYENAVYSVAYQRDRYKLFEFESTPEKLFSPSIRSQVVKHILDRQAFSYEDSTSGKGIDQLIAKNVYAAAYPLHDGAVDADGSKRQELYAEWITKRTWYRPQPRDLIKDYFGVQVALYFEWLAHYTTMLMFASIAGIVCVICGIIAVFISSASNEVCSGAMSNQTMCPTCDSCTVTKLANSCRISRMNSFLDNYGTVFFSIIMSIWAICFLEFWKRRSASIRHEWNLDDMDKSDEDPRPEFLDKCKKAEVKDTIYNLATKRDEPNPDFWKQALPISILSYTIVIVLVLLSIFIFSIIFATQTALKGWLTKIMGNDIFATVVSSTLTLCVSFGLNMVSARVAIWATKLEYIRTQREFEDSMTFKLYLFKFVSYYTPIFMIAFYKGRFTGSPNNFNTDFGHRQAECDIGGCMFDLFIYLMIFMVAKQTWGEIQEILTPILKPILTPYINCIFRHKCTMPKKSEKDETENPQWLRDYKLVEYGSRDLFYEYLEMVIQYGFVTMFAAAFPLAPICALINNVLEIRFDAQKLLKFHRRPVSVRVDGIGVWYPILDGVAKLSVFTNGLLIAFTTEFIPRLVYENKFSVMKKWDNYIDFSLSHANLTYFKNYTGDEKTCRYPDYKTNDYELSEEFWTILVFRLLFVILFQAIVTLVLIFIQWAIPDVPAKLKHKIKIENYLINEIVMNTEKRKTTNLGTISENNGHARAVIPSLLSDDVFLPASSSNSPSD